MQRVSTPVFPQANSQAESAVEILKQTLALGPLMGRELKTKAPILLDILLPNLLRDADVRAADEKTKRAYKLNYDHKNSFAADPEKSFYLVNSPAGVLPIDHKQLQPLPKESSGGVPASGSLPASNDIGISLSSPNTTVSTTFTFTPINKL
ncbi:hypothetical protein PoB_004429000 [Plakobranchus ocellatus]|uniref:Uncharacterized protein n=1 Tax=Plakobranchus ocellatus TaxID=259542 RepID=A0AAV4BAZ5_9GAST|nr:hypothetical protein PoB_004429000 [Plakobranchus ocellatus]